MTRREDLLNFIAVKKIPLRIAIKMLERAERELTAKPYQKEKAVLPKYQTR